MRAAQERNSTTVIKCQECGKRLYGTDIAMIKYHVVLKKGKLHIICPECYYKWP